MNIVKNRDYYEVRDTYNRFVCSCDTYEEALKELEEYIEAQNKTKVFVVTYSAAKSRWITKNGKKLQVPIEEFRRFKKLINAKTEQEAVRRIEKPDHVIVDVSAQVV